MLRTTKNFFIKAKAKPHPKPARGKPRARPNLIINFTTPNHPAPPHTTHYLGLFGTELSDTPTHPTYYYAISYNELRSGWYYFRHLRVNFYSASEESEVNEESEESYELDFYGFGFTTRT